MNPSPRIRTAQRWRWLVLLWTGCLLALARPAAEAYELEGIRWPANQPISMDLHLGSPNFTLSDGSTSWDQVAQAALDLWNPYLGDGVQFRGTNNGTSPVKGDGVNSVFFSRTVYGQDFGNDTLGITLYRYDGRTNEATEAEVIFNSAKSFDSYRGPLRRSGRTYSTDLRRVMLHEFGHVLGLDHTPQGEEAIMTPAVTDIDALQDDDITGVQAIYGRPVVAVQVPVIRANSSTSATVGRNFSYRISATNNPTSYQASGLPPGLSLDPNNGAIFGTPTRPGTFQITLGATNSAGTGTGLLTLVLADTPTITGNLTATAYVGSAFYYQIEAAGQPTSYSVFSLPDGLVVNEFTGLISGTPRKAGVFNLSLEVRNNVGSDFKPLILTVAYDATLTVVHNFGGPSDIGYYPSNLLLGNDGNLYGTTLAGGTTIAGTFFRLTPDGTPSPLYNFSVSGAAVPASLAQAPDGSFYGASSGNNFDSAGVVFKLTADGTLTVIGRFPAAPFSFRSSPTVLLANDGNYYGTYRFEASPTGAYAGYAFKLTPAGVLTVLHQFNGADGIHPSALTQAKDGNFYGTTSTGGSENYGTVFKLTPDGTLTTLHTFTAAEGVNPQATLLQTADGNFYGTTAYSTSSFSNGTAFRLTPDGVFTTIHVFTDTEGRHPQSALVQGSDGGIYGSTGGNYPDPTNPGLRLGVIFKLSPEGAVTVVHSFSNRDDTSPAINLIPTADGNFYGAVRDQDLDSTGTVFKITPGAVPLVSEPPPAVLPAVTLAATVPQVTVGSGAAGVCTLTLSAPQDHDVIVNLTIKGNAVNGADYALLKATKKIKAGKTSKAIKIAPLGNLGGAARKTVVLTLAPGDGYTVDTTGKVKLKLVAP